MLTAVKPQAKISKKRIIQADQSSFSDYSASKRSLGKKVREWELVRVVGGISFTSYRGTCPFIFDPLFPTKSNFTKVFVICLSPGLWTKYGLNASTKSSYLPRRSVLSPVLAPSPPPTVIWLLNFQTPKVQPLKLDNCRPARQTK